MPWITSIYLHRCLHHSSSVRSIQLNVTRFNKPCTTHQLLLVTSYSTFLYQKAYNAHSNKSISKKSTPINVIQQTAKCSLSVQRKLVLGIESSCDDTGAAVVDDKGNILGESINSQTRIHVEAGGIIPNVAKVLHEQHVDEVVASALNKAGVTIHDVDAIAATVKPGLVMSLRVGLRCAQQLVKTSGKPFIPIHHMEAHALTARMMHDMSFPYLVLLISGGHALLAVVRGVEDFILLGRGLDDAPGDAFDKVARELKLKNLPGLSEISGGAAVEKLARTGDPMAFEITEVMTGHRTCDFSFSGLKVEAIRIVKREEKKYGLDAVSVLPNAADICANLQYCSLIHLSKRLQRALLYCEMENLLPKNPTVVLSGGVACNDFLRSGLSRICGHNSATLVCPPPHLCTDNGIMIAWNGMEKLLLGTGVHPDPDSVEVEGRSPLGLDYTDKVRHANLKIDSTRTISHLLSPEQSGPQR